MKWLSLIPDITKTVNKWRKMIFFEFSKVVIINMIAILIILAKLATPGLLKIKTFFNKGYHVKISVHGVTNKTLSTNSNNIVDVLR